MGDPLDPPGQSPPQSHLWQGGQAGRRGVHGGDGHLGDHGHWQRPRLDRRREPMDHPVHLPTRRAVHVARRAGSVGMDRGECRADRRAIPTRRDARGPSREYWDVCAATRPLLRGWWVGRETPGHLVFRRRGVCHRHASWPSVCLFPREALAPWDWGRGLHGLRAECAEIPRQGPVLPNPSARCPGGVPAPAGPIPRGRYHDHGGFSGRRTRVESDGLPRDTRFGRWAWGPSGHTRTSHLDLGECEPRFDHSHLSRGWLSRPPSRPSTPT